jgi:hypothetical protein
MARTKAVLGTGARLSDYLSASLLARVVPADDIHAVLNAHGCNSQRTRSFPAVTEVYYCIALSLYPEAAYEEVFAVVAVSVHPPPTLPNCVAARLSPCPGEPTLHP